MKVKNLKLVIGFMLSAIMFAMCAVVTGIMDVTPDWVPNVFDFCSIIASVLGIKVVVPTRESVSGGEGSSMFPKTDGAEAGTARAIEGGGTGDSQISSVCL